MRRSGGILLSKLHIQISGRLAQPAPRPLSKAPMRRLSAALLLAAVAAPALAEPAKDPIRKAPHVLKPAEHGVGRLAPDIAFTDTTGRAGKLSDFKDKKAVVVLFTSTSCPVSQKYAPAASPGWRRPTATRASPSSTSTRSRPTPPTTSPRRSRPTGSPGPTSTTRTGRSPRPLGRRPRPTPSSSIRPAPLPTTGPSMTSTGSATRCRPRRRRTWPRPSTPCSPARCRPFRRPRPRAASWT